MSKTETTAEKLNAVHPLLEDEIPIPKEIRDNQNMKKSVTTPAAKTADELITSLRNELTCLEAAGVALESMTSEQRERAFKFFKSKFSKEWPSDPTY